MFTYSKMLIAWPWQNSQGTNKLIMVKQQQVVVITGGVASGKSAATEFFAELGVPVIDTDQLAREVVAPGSDGLSRLSDLLGSEILLADGQLNRPLMRQKIISDPQLRQQVEQILHPLIEQLAIERIEQTQGPYCLLAVPLLVESGRFRWAPRVLAVDVPETLQIERLIARDTMNKDQAAAMLATQASRAQRLDIADDVIDNSGSLAQLQAQVQNLHQQYLAFFKQT